MFKNIFSSVVSINSIKEYIERDSIKVVSFDIFDTLLIRPSFDPKDIFYLINSVTDKKYKNTFVEMRWNAEDELKSNDLSIFDIYNYIRDKYALSQEDADELLKEEFECERCCLHVRDDMCDVYNHAISKGKKVIAVSDMYLPSEFLLKVLHDKGYDKIEKVYVSNEFHARKDNGILYAKVIELERVEPSQIVHLGDNYESDYVMARKYGINSIYYPSIRDLVCGKNSIYQSVFHNVSNDPYCRIVIGYFIHRQFKNRRNYTGYAFFSNFKSFIKFGIAPIVFFIAHNICTNKNIQDQYSKILFCSRDGYLPMKAYSIISKYIKTISYEYIYTGRRATYPLLHENFFEFIETVKKSSAQKMSVKDFIDCYIFDRDLRYSLYNGLDSLEEDFFEHKSKVLGELQKFKQEINAYFTRIKQNAFSYYLSKIDGGGRCVAYDAGYSGSIGLALSHITHTPFDKIYLWETDKNKKLDRISGSKTILIMNNELPAGFDLVYEELFSPLQGGALYFDDALNPVFENFTVAYDMAEKYEVINNIVPYEIDEICKFLGKYLSSIRLQDGNSFQKLIFQAFTSSPYNEISLLRGISFPDPVANYNEELESKFDRLVKIVIPNTVIDGYDAMKLNFINTNKKYIKLLSIIFYIIYKFSVGKRRQKYKQKRKVCLDILSSL